MSSASFAARQYYAHNFKNEDQDAGSDIFGRNYGYEPAWDLFDPNTQYQMRVTHHSSTYDPVSHGFIDSVHKALHDGHTSFNAGWMPPSYNPARSNRHISPMSGVSSVGTFDSSSPSHNSMSPEMATVMLASMVHDQDFCSSTVSPHNDHHLLASGSGYMPSTMMVLSQHYSMRDFERYPDYHGDDTFGQQVAQEVLHKQVPDVTDHTSSSSPELAPEQTWTDMFQDTITAVDGDVSCQQHGGPKIGHTPHNLSEQRTMQPRSGIDTKSTSNVVGIDKGSFEEASGPLSSHPSRKHARTHSTATMKPPPKKRRISAISHPAPSSARTRQPLHCPFHHFGCNAVFPSKNEWKRHTLSQHLQLGFYRCDQGTCAADHPSGVTLTRGYNDFNRKDLFTQHCRRMHKPISWGFKEYNTVGSREKSKFDAEMDSVRDRCWVRMREAPAHMGCGFCDQEWEVIDQADGEGEKVWEARMEHIAGHYAAGATAEAEAVDVGFSDWAVGEGVVVWSDGALMLSSLVADSVTEQSIDKGRGKSLTPGTRRKGKSPKPVGVARAGIRKSGRLSGGQRMYFGEDDEEDVVSATTTPDDTAGNSPADAVHNDAVIVNELPGFDETDTDAEGEEDA